MADDKNIELFASLDYSDFTAGIDDMQSQIADIEGGVEVEVTTNVDTSGIDALDEIPDETETEFNVAETEDAKQAFADLHFMALKDKLETVWNIVQKGVDIAADFVNPLLDVDDAVAHINAQTGNGTGIADLGQFIRDTQKADLGENVQQIEDVVIAATQLHAPIEEATQASLTFTHTFKNQDPVTVMQTLKATADEFGVSITEASDLMTVFFQQGGNKGGDALATVDRYSTSWHDMGLSITEALSLVNSLMTGGVDTADAAAKMVQTFDDSLTTASADPNSQQAKLLKAMGIDNPKDSGEAIGAETIDGFVAAFNNLPADQQDLASQLFFGKGGKLNTSAIAGATTQSSMFADVIGAAKDAAAEMDDSLRGAIDDFILAVNSSVADFLASDKIDLDGFITRLKDGFQAAVGVLSGGGTIGEALEVGFNIQGFDTTVANLQRIFGNFEIIILQAVAAIQRLQGIDTTGIDEQIATLAKGQLKFDLQLGNVNEIPGMIQTAISRGVTGDELMPAISDAIEEAWDSGDFSQALDIAEGFKLALTKAGADPTVADTMITGLTSSLNSELNDALTSGDFTLAETIGKALEIDPTELDTVIQDAKNKMSEAFAPQQRTGGVFEFTSTPQGGLEETFQKRMGLDTLSADAKDATDGVVSSVETMQTGVQTSLEATAGSFANTTVAAQLMDTDIAGAMTGNTVTATFEEVAKSAEENFTIVVRWLDITTQKVFDLDFAAGQLSNIPDLLKEITEAIDKFDPGKLTAIAAAANGLGGAQSTINNNNTTINATQNNNISNNAQSAAAGYEFAANVRGQ